MKWLWWRLESFITWLILQHKSLTCGNTPFEIVSLAKNKLLSVTCSRTPLQVAESALTPRLVSTRVSPSRKPRPRPQVSVAASPRRGCSHGQRPRPNTNARHRAVQSPVKSRHWSVSVSGRDFHRGSDQEVPGSGVKKGKWISQHGIVQRVF